MIVIGSVLNNVHWIEKQYCVRIYELDELFFQTFKDVRLSQIKLAHEDQRVKSDTIIILSK